jgi:hypothetical protein
VFRSVAGELECSVTLSPSQSTYLWDALVTECSAWRPDNVTRDRPRVYLSHRVAMVIEHMSA